MSGEIKCVCGKEYAPRFHNTCPNCGVDSSFAGAPGSVDSVRLRFVQRLIAYDADGQHRLLNLESDDEIGRLKRIALNEQCFEAAAACSKEQQRRERELSVNPPNVESSNDAR